MYRALVLVLLSSYGLSSCTSAAPDTSLSATPTATKQPVTARPDSAAAIIKPFFRCYKQCLRTQYPYHFIRISRGQPYRLNASGVAAYLRAVQACGPLSTHYQATLTNHFQAIAQHLLREPQDDGEVAGLEADPVVLNGDNEDFKAGVDSA